MFLLFAYAALTAREQQVQSQQNAAKQIKQAAVTADKTTAKGIGHVHVPLPPVNLTDSARPLTPSSQHTPISSQSSTVVSRGHDLTSTANRDTTISRGNISQIGAGLASSMERVLLISDGELMPMPWGVSSNFLSSDNIRNASIPQEWIEEMDIWT